MLLFNGAHRLMVGHWFGPIQYSYQEPGPDLRTYMNDPDFQHLWAPGAPRDYSYSAIGSVMENLPWGEEEQGWNEAPSAEATFFGDTVLSSARYAQYRLYVEYPAGYPQDKIQTDISRSYLELTQKREVATDQWELAETNPAQTRTLVANEQTISMGSQGIIVYVSEVKTLELAGGDREEWKIKLIPIDLRVDHNRDGEINGSDNPTQEKPFRFWINNDDDPESLDGKDDEDTDPSSKDWETTGIDGVRDLEDFTRLHLNLPDFIIEKAKAGEAQVGFKWTGGTGPRIRIYKSAEAEGRRKYLSDDATAQLQCGNDYKNHLCDVQGTAAAFLPSSYWSTIASDASKLCFLFEGCSTGTGKLTLVVKFGSSAENEAGGIHMKLMNARDMFQRERIDVAGPDSIPHPWDTTASAAPLYSSSIGNFDQDPDEEKDCIVFVHGWRMSEADTLSWSETTFKRLWQLGYKGRLATFRWPTYSAETNPAAGGRLTYNNSEYRAWLSGRALAQFVNSLPITHNRYLMAHSMGNVVSGSAFREGMAGVSYYAMFNAAMAAMSYDDTQIHHPTRETPDTHSDTETNKFGLANKFNPMTWYPDGPEAKVINFYLPDDFALKSWDTNHTLNKPNNALLNPMAPHYAYTPTHNATGSTPITRLWRNPVWYSDGTISGTVVDDLAEAMAYVTQTRSYAAGRMQGAAGSISKRINLSSYEFDNEHSAEWVWSIQKTYRCFKKLLTQFQIQTIPENAGSN